MNRRQILQNGLAAWVGASHPLSFGQTSYPNKPITIIVPFPPGGVTDLVARELAKRISESFGQACTVENKAGAGGNIGTAALARAAPDGYTLGVMTVSAISIAPHVTPNLPFNPDKDFTPITNIVNTPGALLAGIKTPYQTVSELVRAAKERPGKITYASVGNGSLPHLVGERFCKTFAVDLLHVPYKGAAPALQDLLAGVVDLSFESALTNTVTNAAAGKLRVLATTGAQRAPVLANVPTLNELSAGFVAQGWFGLLGPAGLPDGVVTRVHAVAMSMLKDPVLLDRFEKLGIEADPKTPQAFRSYLSEQSLLWGNIAKQLKL